MQTEVSTWRPKRDRREKALCLIMIKLLNCLGNRVRRNVILGLV
jgi:hypothetical protein